MKKYIVNQCCRISLTQKETAENKGKVKPYKFTRDLTPGTYTQEDLVNAVGKEFIENPKFAEFCDIGFIKVIEEKDLTQNVIKSFKKL